MTGLLPNLDIRALIIASRTNLESGPRFTEVWFSVQFSKVKRIQVLDRMVEQLNAEVKMIKKGLKIRQNLLVYKLWLECLTIGKQTCVGLSDSAQFRNSDLDCILFYPNNWFKFTLFTFLFYLPGKFFL